MIGVGLLEELRKVERNHQKWQKSRTTNVLFDPRTGLTGDELVSLAHRGLLLRNQARLAVVSILEVSQTFYICLYQVL